MTSQTFVLQRNSIREPGFLLAGNVNAKRTELGQQTFLLAPGGQDYVGDNDYDLRNSRESGDGKALRL